MFTCSYLFLCFCQFLIATKENFPELLSQVNSIQLDYSLFNNSHFHILLVFTLSTMQFLQSLLIECKNDKNNVCEKTIIRIMKEKQHISNFYIEWYNQYLSSYLYNTLVYGVSFWTAASIALWLARASLELLIRIITSRPGTIKDHIIYRMLSRVYSGYTGILVLFLIYYLYQKLFPQKQKDESFAFQLFGFTVEIRSLRSETDADCSLSNLVGELN